MKNRAAFSLIELLVVIGIISLLAALLFPVFERAREQGRGAACLSNLRQVGMSLQLYLQDYDEAYPMNRMPDNLHPLGGCALTGGSAFPITDLETSSLNWRRVVQPYLKNKAVQICPSNPYAQTSPFPELPPGDQTNSQYPATGYLPLSYAYNGNFFHEGVPPCLYKEKLERPRTEPEISAPSNLLLLVESRYPNPDLGSWLMIGTYVAEGRGYFQSHNAGSNFLFADLHAKRMKLAATCSGKMWTDSYPDGSTACKDLSGLAEEYR